MKKVSIGIPSIYPEGLKCALSSIQKYTKNIDYEVIVVGPEKIGEVIKKIENTKFILEAEQKGSVKAVQKALDMANGEYFVWLNDDVLATENWLNNMLNFLESYHTNSFLCGSFRMKLLSGKELPQGYVDGRFIGADGKFPYAMFGCMKTERLREMGGWNRDYHSWYVDPDLGMRIWKAKGKVVICPTAWIIHSIEERTNKWKKDVNQFLSKDEELFHKYWGYPRSKIEKIKDIIKKIFK